MKDILLQHFTENADLKTEELEEILGFFRELKIKKNDFWIKQNQSSNDIAFLAKGILRLFHENDGEEITLEFIFPNSFTTSISSNSTNITNPWNFQALTDCEMLLINKKVHTQLILKSAAAIQFYEKQLIQNFINKEKKLFSHLNLNAKQRFEKLFSEQPQIFNQVALKHIASSLGIAPETLSRFRNKFAKEKS